MEADGGEVMRAKRDFAIVRIADYLPLKHTNTLSMSVASFASYPAKVANANPRQKAKNRNNSEPLFQY